MLKVQNALERHRLLEIQADLSKLSLDFMSRTTHLSAVYDDNPPAWLAATLAHHLHALYSSHAFNHTPEDNCTHVM